MANISILTIGSEILDGRVQDTNANYLCELFTNLGFRAINILTCDDVIEDIVSALDFVSLNSNVVIVSGGLGPTTDDLTREAIAKYCNKNLILDEQSLVHMQEYFKKRGRKLEECNKQQAYFPETATVIPNSVGTAPGFFIENLNQENKSVIYFSVPGVPSELFKMVESTIIPEIQKRFPNIKPTYRKSFKVFSVPEAVVNARITSLNLPPEIVVSYRAKFPEIHVILKSPNASVENYFESVKVAVGKEFIITEDLQESSEEVLHKILIRDGVTIAGAESCTGGAISTLLTNTPGSSKYFLGCNIVYSNQTKHDELGIDKSTIEKFGAVSPEVAIEMAKNAREKFRSTLAYSITGIAGPDGGSKEKPVGLFYIGLAHEKGVYCLKGFHLSSRKGIRAYSSYLALDVIRRHLLSLPPQKDANI